MKLVIDISHNLYDAVFLGNELTSTALSELHKAVKKGTPLPKGHDRLVEARAVVKALFDKKTIDDVPTIIEADKAESEDKE